MARVELRDATILLKDGLSGSATIEEATPGATDTDCEINTVVLNTTDNDLVPIGARFTVNTANNTEIYTVTGRTGTNEIQTVNIDDAVDGGNFTLTFEAQESAAIQWNAVAADVETALEALSTIGANNVSVSGGAGPATDWIVEFVGAEKGVDQELLVGDGANLNTGATTVIVTETQAGDVNKTANVEFTPAWGADTPTVSDAITFQAQELEITIGEGNLTWTEAKEYEYLLDRGDLDTVKEGDEQPLEISLEFVFEFVLTGTSETITPVDAVKGSGGADEWVSSAEDQCEPYAVDMVVRHCVPCGTAEDEELTFPDFRYESLEYDLSEATISVSGRCNVSEATSLRSTNAEC